MTGTPGRGLVAIGDSITRGGGDSMLGLTMRSWAQWVAEAVELPYTCLAVDAARTGDALAEQVPRLRGPYEIGCVYLGVNDVRTSGFDGERFGRELAAILAAVSAAAAEVVIVGLPAQIGRPPAPDAAIRSANETIGRLARTTPALQVPLSGLSGFELVLPDAVHLTARGQAFVAARVCDRLLQHGWTPRDGAIREALEPLGRRERVRHLICGHAPALGRDLRRRWRER